MNFQQKLIRSIKKNNSLLCIGLDSDINKLPKHLLKKSDPIFAFNKAIIDSTHDLVCAYKPQIAYYSSLGVGGLISLQKTIDYIKKNYPFIPVILDAKRGDIGSTSEKYAIEVFDIIGADGVTVNPYLGFDALEPFLRRGNKGIIILCRTSNPGASDFQDLKINGRPLYMEVASRVVSWNKKYQNCLMVVGATWPKQLREIRTIAPNMFFLIPGIGTQGGDLEKTLEFGLTKDKSGLIINVSRAIIYASGDKNFSNEVRNKAIAFRNDINQYRI